LQNIEARLEQIESSPTVFDFFVKSFLGILSTLPSIIKYGFGLVSVFALIFVCIKVSLLASILRIVCSPMIEMCSRLRAKLDTQANKNEQKKRKHTDRQVDYENTAGSMNYFNAYGPTAPPPDSIIINNDRATTNRKSKGFYYK